MDKFIIIGVLILCAILGSVAQILLKYGMDSKLMYHIVVYVFFGLVLYAVAMGLYLLILRFGEVGRIYSMISLSYVFVMLLSYYYLGESLTYSKILGSVIIVSGVFIIWS